MVPIEGGADACMTFSAQPYTRNGVPIGFSLPPANSGGVDCSSLYNATDGIAVYGFIFKVNERMLVRKQGAIDFFSTTQQGWNVSLIFIAVLAYLVTRPYNKRVAAHSVASGAALSAEEQVDVLLDMSSLLLYLRAKEAVMGADRSFYKQQL